MLARIRCQASYCAEFNPGSALALFLFLAVVPVPLAAQIVQVPSMALLTCQLPEPLREIALMGSKDFRLRCDAGKRLLANPLESHDWVFRAQSSTDCEIAHSAHQLLIQLQYQLLTRFAPQYQSILNSGRSKAGVAPSLTESEKAIFRISHIGEPESTNNLLAIAQFEPQEELAIRAATELMSANREPGSDQIDSALLWKNPRPSSRCLGIWFSQHESPEAFLDLWEPVAAHVLAHYPRETDVLPDHVLGWLRATATRYRQLGLNESADELALQMIPHVWNRSNDIVEIYDWLLADDAVAVLHELNCQCADTIRKSPRLLFRLSEFQHRIGRWERAKATLDQAINSIQGDSGKSIELAIHLRSRGLERIAIELLERITANANDSDGTALVAGRLLARYRHDQFDDLSAATALECVVNRIPNSTKPVNRTFEVSRKEAVVELAYYWHRHFAIKGDLEQATHYLVSGLQDAPDNSELLIAAWRFQGISREWPEIVDELIEISLAKLENQIQACTAIRLADPREQHSLEHERIAALNTYAWLASQTERHLETAETFARLAMAGTPESPELMDTLASCLSARGQYVEAIALQRKAIGLDPFNSGLQANLVRHQEAEARRQSQATNR